MGSLAAVLLAQGDRVSGSDALHTARVRALQRAGVLVFPGQAAENVDGSVEAVVHSAAVRPDHPELAEALRKGIPTFKYAPFVARELERSGKRVVAVAGTHGKTTTTSLVAHVLEHCGRDPACIVGGWPLDWTEPGRFGAGGEFVLEACEYDRSFLNYRVHAAIVTNVEGDHLDYFGDAAAVEQAFQEFLAAIPAGGGPLIVHESAARRLDLGRVPARCVLIGEGRGVHDRILWWKRGSARGAARLCIQDGPELMLRPRTPGEHNLHNAAVAASMCVRLGAPAAQVEEAIAGFRGVRRRLEPLGVHDGAEWFSDYAHHPTEVAAVRDTLTTHWPRSSVTVVFQPHQVSRSRVFRARFVDALRGIDEVVFPGIYAAREAAAVRQQAEDEFEFALRDAGIDVLRAHGVDDVPEALRRRPRRRDVVVLMGAGDIERLAEPLRAPRTPEAAAHA